MSSDKSEFQLNYRLIAENVRNLAARRRSFTLFKVSEPLQATLSEIVVRATGCSVISAHDLQLNAAFPKGVLLTDFSWQHAALNGDVLHRFIVRLSRDRVPLWLFITDEMEDWKPESLWVKQDEEAEQEAGETGRQHIEWDQLRAYQFLQESKSAGSVFISPQMLEFATTDPPLTAIEQRLAEAMSGGELQFNAGARIGPFHVDFIVRRGDKAVGVECDGYNFHKSDEAKRRDQYRDEKIREHGLEVLRFSGRQIWRGALLCVASIHRHLNGESDTTPRVEILKPVSADLDKSQEGAVEAPEGMLRILAPAGAGKTKVIVNRIVHLVNLGYPQSHILPVAFNRKAADQMNDRLGEIEITGVQAHTFHSLGRKICTNVLGINWRPDRKVLRTNKTAISSQEEKRLIHEAIAERLFDLLSQRVRQLNKKDRKRTRILMEAYDRIKDTLSPPGEHFAQTVVALASSPTPLKDLPQADATVWREVFEATLDFQVTHSLYTFADMIYLAVRRLSEDVTTLLDLQTKWDVILVDEFQDLNSSQLSLIDLLSSTHQNVTVVGDDDQMIYGFRGARVDYILDFFKLFPGSNTRTLSVNYRCAKRLVRHAGYLIKNNTQRVDKTIQPWGKSPVGIIKFRAGNNLNEEIDYVLEFIKAQREKGRSWKDIGVITRYKQVIEPLLHKLRTYGIPFNTVSHKFFSTTPVMTVIAYLKAIYLWPTPPSSVWSEILKVPNKFLPYKFIGKVAVASDPYKLIREDPESNPAANEAYAKLAALSVAIKGKSTEEIIETLDAAFLLTDYFKQQINQGDDNDNADEGMIVDGLKYYAKLYSDPLNFIDFCEKQIAEEKQREGQDAEKSKEAKEVQDAVSVLTIHTAKGKEWPAVVLFHGEDRSPGKPPAKPKSISSEKWGKQQREKEEEERRVYYVAVTRAEEEILLTATACKVTRYFHEYLKNPAFKKLTSNSELKAKTDEERQQLERATNELLDLERRIKDARSRADERLMHSRLATHKEIISKHSGPLVAKRRAFEQTRECIDYFVRSGDWGNHERLQRLKENIGLPVIVEEYAALFRAQQSAMARIEQTLTIRELIKEFIGGSSNGSSIGLEKLQIVEEHLSISLKGVYLELRANTDLHARMEKQITRGDEDLAELRKRRSLWDKAKSIVGIPLPIERKLEEQIEGFKTKRKQASRDMEDDEEKLRRLIARRLEEAEAEFRLTESNVNKFCALIEKAVRGAIAYAEKEVIRVEGIVKKAEESIARIKAEREAAVTELAVLQKEAERKKQEICSRRETIYQLKFEMGIRIELAKLPRTEENKSKPGPAH
jgi:DNA helicase-2/ATP-dependent DNA helicase PcrA